MKLIFYHFLHLYFLTEFEVIFYIYYVMPYEKQLILNLFDSNDITSILPFYNKTLIELYNNKYNNNNCNTYQNRLDNYNSKLFNYCIIYIIIINVLLVMLFIKDIYQNYNIFCDTNISPTNQIYKLSCNPSSSLMAFKSSQNIAIDYKKNDDNCVELQDINSNIESAHNNDTKNELKSIRIQIDDIFIVYYYKKSELIKEIFKLTQFIILVGIFEYLFFTTIVNKYKIANIDTILCNIESKIL
uniref:Uncharacterized protein n=1 Tax=viral metagenome TaxID=1070528 RepID=A0A6C0IFD7_9ZZZZ